MKIISKTKIEEGDEEKAALSDQKKRNETGVLYLSRKFSRLNFKKTAKRKNFFLPTSNNQQNLQQQ